jgi:hypothetical protein
MDTQRRWSWTPTGCRTRDIHQVKEQLPRQPAERRHDEEFEDSVPVLSVSAFDRPVPNWCAVDREVIRVRPTRLVSRVVADPGVEFLGEQGSQHGCRGARPLSPLAVMGAVWQASGPWWTYVNPGVRGDGGPTTRSSHRVAAFRRVSWQRLSPSPRGSLVAAPVARTGSSLEACTCSEPAR